MIPVRVPADTPLHIVRRGLVIAADHPLAEHACADPLSGRPCSLVYVGTHPSDRARGGAYWTGAAVAVHDECAGEALDRPGAPDLDEDPDDGAP